MTKLTIIIILLIIPLLALISEAITPEETTSSFQTEAQALIPTTSNRESSSISTSKKQGDVPLKVHFDAIVNDAQNNNTAYSWNFGDGHATKGKRVTHAFTLPGEYTTTLTITDHRNFTTQHATTITVTD